MSGETIFWPVLVQVALTFIIYALASARRVSAVKSGISKPSDYRVPIIEPESSATAIRNLSNQFELPVLFYLCCVVLFNLGAVSTSALFLAWAFALSRIVHAYVHVTSNRMRQRRPLFIIGFVIVAVMWIMVLVRLIPSS